MVFQSPPECLEVPGVVGVLGPEFGLQFGPAAAADIQSGPSQPSP